MSKNFNDFAEKLDERIFTEMAEDINSLKIKVSLPINNEQDLQNFINAITISNTRMTLNLLNLYHQWLTDDLDD